MIVATTEPGSLIAYLRRTAQPADGGQLSDGQLLDAYVTDKDHAAFAALVRRHGPMVLGVCRRVLGDAHEAEDAFQATFFVLVRKAGAVSPREMVGSWLHGVAYHVARRAKLATGRRLARERKKMAMAASASEPSEVWQDLCAVLDQELQTLPEKYRLPIVLCELEGKSRKEASTQLGWPEGTVASRLGRGRALLSRRINRHGLVLTSAALAAAFAHKPAAAAVPVTLLSNTLKAASIVATGKATAGAVSTTALALAEGVVKTMLVTKITKCTVIGLVLTIVVGGSGWIGSGLVAGQAPAVSQKAAATSALLPGGQAAVGQKSDAERIVGSWVIVKVRANGDGGPDGLVGLAQFSFTKEGSMALTIAGEAAKSGKYSLPAAGKIDLDLGGNERAQGIYKFDGADKLTLCANNGPNNARPTEFSAEQGSKNILFVLERVDPNKKMSAEEAAKAKEAMTRVREAASRMQSANNLKQIAIAMHNYHDTYQHLPMHAIYSKDGKTPLLSWRVAILPFIDQVELYNQFKLDEPWSSEHNKALIAKMPATYLTREVKELDKGLTYYQVFTGPNTVFNGNQKMKITDITDGTSYTILAIEGKDPVIWTKPEDLVFPKEKDKFPAVGGHFKDQVITGMCDGSVRYMRADLPVATLRALVTPKGGEQIPELENLQKKD
jgi:RNA polymerase sigma factor (sigma-70 family)